MYKARIYLILLVTILTFVLSWFLVRFPEVKSELCKENLLVTFFEGINVASSSFWKDLTLLMLSFGVSIGLRRPNKCNLSNGLRYLCPYSTVFSILSLLIIVAAVRFHDENIAYFGLLIFFLTSLVLSATIYSLAWLRKNWFLVTLKIIIVGALAFMTTLFSSALASRAIHGGEQGLSMLVLSLVVATVAGILSVVINIRSQLNQKRGRK